MNVKQEGSSPAAEEEEDETPAHTLSDLVPSPRVSSLSTSPPTPAWWVIMLLLSPGRRSCGHTGRFVFSVEQ